MSSSCSAAQQNVAVAPEVPAADLCLTRTTDGCTAGSRSSSTLVVTQSLKITDGAMLRGTPINTILQRCARVLRDKRGSSRTYDMSTPAKVLVFLSHNWSTWWPLKYLCWALHFQWRLAVACSAIVLCICLLFDAGGYGVYDGFMGPSGTFGRFVLPTFMATLLLGADVQTICRLPGPTCFLDKTCIHQTDQEAKKKGIRSLGAFLSRSKQMVICYSSLYLKRLWTTYEVACFLLLHPPEHLVVLPTWLAPLVFIAAGSFYLVSIPIMHLPVSTEKLHPTAMRAITLGLGFLMCVLLSWLFRRNARERANMLQTVSEFRIQDAHCDVEDDRVLVERNIVAMMQCSGLVSRDASSTEALEAFNELVRGLVPEAIGNSLGRAGFPFHYAVLLWYLILPFSLDIWSARSNGMHPAMSAMGLMDMVVGQLIGGPTLFGFISLCSSWRVHMTALAEVAYLMSLGLTSCLLGFALVHLFSEEMPKLSMTGRLVGALVSYTLLALLASAFYMKPHRAESQAFADRVKLARERLANMVIDNP